MAELLEQRKKRAKKGANPYLKRAAAETIERLDTMAEVGMLSVEEAKIARGRLMMGVIPIDNLLNTVDALQTLGMVDLTRSDSMKRDISTMHSQSVSVLEATPVAKTPSKSFYLNNNNNNNDQIDSLPSDPVTQPLQAIKRSQPDPSSRPTSSLTALYEKCNPPPTVESKSYSHAEEGAPIVVGNSRYLAEINDDEFEDGERLLEALVGSRLKMEAPLKGKAKRTRRKENSKVIDPANMGEIVTNTDYDFNFPSDTKIEESELPTETPTTGPSRPPAFVLLPKPLIHTSSCKQSLESKIIESFTTVVDPE